MAGMFDFENSTATKERHQGLFALYLSNENQCVASSSYSVTVTHGL